MSRANSVLAEDVGSERFITLFLARLNPTERRLTYASAGHPSGYILSASGDIRATLPRTGVPLGIRPDTMYVSSPEIQLSAGELVLLTTDGIEETMSPENMIFGMERILEVIQTNRARPAAQIVQALYEAVREFSRNAPQNDDVTAIVMKVL